MFFFLIIGSWLWRLALCGPLTTIEFGVLRVLSLAEKVSDIPGAERSQVQLSWGGERGRVAGSVPGESQFSLLSVFGTEEREILRKMSDLGDIDHVKEEKALPIFFPRVINTAITAICYWQALAKLQLHLKQEHNGVFFLYSTESQEAKSLSSQEHSWLIIKLAGYHGWGWPKYQL